MDYFDELSKLKDNIEAFEQRRKELLEEHIKKMAEGNEETLARLSAIQWRIDQERNKYTNQTMRYNRLVEMFWQQVEEFQNLELPQKAEILQFPKSK